MKNSILYTSALLLTGVAPLLTGCRNNTQSQPAPIVDGNAAMSDPASANLLPASGAPQSSGAPATRVAGSQYAAVPQASGENYPAQTAPNYGTGNSQQNEAYNYNTQQPQYDQQQPQPGQQGAPISGQEYDQYSDLLDSNVPAATQPPPPLPVDYEQPEAPGPDYLWTPGYWDYASSGYYYVPGTWVGAPYAGALWTPGWWGYGGSRYRWHHGYWGRHVGYYGGINYGFGFIGFGYQGGYWNGDHFFYNRSVNRVSPRVGNNYIYERRVSVVNSTYINNSRTSYYGGPGGLNRRPAPQEFAALHEQRTPPMQAQIVNRQAAGQNRQQFFNTNNGRPAMLTAERPLAADRGVVAPPRTTPAQGFANGRPEGVGPNGNMNPQQRQQFEQGQRQGQEAQRLQQQQTNLQQQQTNLQQRQQQQVQRQGLDAQHQQQVQTNLQQRQGEQQQRQALDLQRQQQQGAAIQQRQAEQQQRQALDVQRQQAVNAQQQQRQQADAARQQQQQVNAQREQQATQQRQQMDVQRQQQQQQNVQRQQQLTQQREAARPAPAAAPRVEAPRPAPAAAPRAEAPRPAPAAAAPRPAPAPHVEAPRPAPAPQAPHAAPAAAPHAEHH